MTLSAVIKGLNAELHSLSQIGGLSLDVHGKVRNMPRKPFESDIDYRNRMQRQIRDEMFDQSQAEQAGKAALPAFSQCLVDIPAVATLEGRDLDHIAKRYGLEREPDEKDCWFRVRIQRAASGIIQKARYWMQDPMPEMPTPSGREIFEREYMTKIEPKRYTLDEAFAIICQGIHPASFMRESGRSHAQAAGVVEVIFGMMRRNMEKAGGR